MLFIRSILFWLPMIPVAVANGIVREYTYGRKLPELRAHQLSTGSCIALFALYIWIVFPYLHIASLGQAVTVGLLWAGCTIAFEFIFGHFFAGHSWRRLLQDYNLFAGRLWMLVPLLLAVMPVLLYCWR
jgi:hypothetical protein